MRATSQRVEDIERLVDRHIELSELFEARRARPRARPPALLVPLEPGASLADCLGGLVDRALVAYEGSGFAEDAIIRSLKAALAESIVGAAGSGGRGA